MDDYIYSLTLDLNCNKNTPIINSAQFDKGRKIHLTVTSNGNPFSLSDCTVVLKGVNADKTYLLLDCNVEDNGTAIVSTEDTTFSVAGLTVCKFVISNSVKTYSTQKFIVQVDSSLDGDITLDERYSILDRLIRQIQLIDEHGGILVDDALSTTSTHPVQNRIVAQAINAKMDADDATVYHVDTTTQTLTYDNTNPKTIYLNARVSYGSVSNRAAVVISTSSKGYQFAITVTGDILMRSGGGTYPTDWTVLYGSSYKKNSINDDNKNSSVFIPTIGAVVSYLVANYIGNGSGTVTENNLATALKNSLYRVDNTTENVVYSADNPRTIYTNARVNGNKPTLVFTLGDDSQLAMHKDGHLYCRTYANGAYGSWIDLKATSIGESNKTSGAYPTVQAVYNFVTAFVASSISGKANTTEVGDLKSALNGTVDLIGDTTIYNVSLAESGTGVGANWNHYYDISLPKGTKLNFYLSAYTGVLFTNVLVRFYDTTNTVRSLAPSVMQTGKLQTYTLYEDCTRIWVQINRSATENGVSAQFIMSFDTSGLSADVAKIRSVLPINSEEVLRSDILKYPNLRFKNDNSGGTETAGGDSWVVSDYIPVGLGLTVTGFSYSSTRPGIVEYNFAKAPIGTVATGSSSKYVTKTYTPLSQVGYVRIQTITSIGNDTNAVSVINSTPKIFHVEKDGSGDFTKLSDAINEAVRYMDSTVYVGRGTWNIIDELGVGTDYIVSSDNRGLVLKNRVKVICASDSKITCNYTGSDSDTITWLSAFNAGPLGFTLENATIESSKCRYSVHDERDTDSDSYNNYYINCRMTHDNTNGGYNQCIGGGLGLDGHVIIDGCIFENPARTNYQIVYYHNSTGSGKSFVEVKGSYFKGTNTLGFQWYGSSPATQKSTLFAHGNSLGSAIQHTGASGATVENTEVISFNNEIRP